MLKESENKRREKRGKNHLKLKAYLKENVFFRGLNGGESLEGRKAEK